MKTRTLIIIGISVAIALSLSYYVIYDQSNTVFISCDPRYEQIDDKCIPVYDPEDISFRDFTDEDLERVLNYCNNRDQDQLLMGLEFRNETHYINNSNCEWQVLEKYPNSDRLCIPNQDYSDEEIRNQTHIYDKQNCLWEQVWDGYSHPFGMKEYQKEHYQIEITGLKDVYLIGESYSFSYVISGYGYSCADREVLYPNEDGDVMGQSSMVQCVAGASKEEFVIEHIEELEEIQIKKTGLYTVTVTFDKPSKYFPTTVSKEFRVMEN